MKNSETLRAELSAPLPEDAVKPHPTKTYLSSIKAIYVTERLNSVFGIGKWKVKVDPVERSENGMVVVKTTFEVPEYGIYYECFGGNDNGGENSKNFDLGDAYKGATTDAITKIGSYLEIGIDVFKGKHTPEPQNKPANQESNNKPWLNKTDKAGNITDNWNAVVNALASKAYNLGQVESKYKLSKENKQELLNIK